MGNAKKIMINGVLVLVAVGVLMIVAAAAMGELHIKNMKGLSYKMKTFDVEEAFSDIHIQDEECNVRIMQTTDGKSKVICPEKEDGSIYHTVTVNDGVLTIQRHDKRKWYQYIGISFGSENLDVYLTEKEYGQLVAVSTAGSIQVSDGFSFVNASLKSTSGSIQMFSQVTRNLEAEATSGRITIENASPETLTAKSISGRIVLSHIRSGEIAAQATSGKIELVDVVAEKDLFAQNVSGGVTLDRCDGGTIRIETTSGSVKGTILSDKLFITDSTNGSVNVPRSLAGGECEISTTSGNISIEIKR